MARDPKIVWQEGDEPEPVTPETPLEGVELRVLAVWLEKGKGLAKAYREDPAAKADLETAVRYAYNQ